MSKYLQMTDALMAYIEKVGVRENPVQARCRRETAEMGRISGMQIAPDEGALLALLVKLIGAKHCVEVGVFTGYSALSVALALPDDGTIDACDISAEYVERAKAYWREAGVEKKIRTHVGPAVATLDRLIADGGSGHYDFAFIDADKTSYDAYYERCLKLLRAGGLLAVDNTLWSGAVIDKANTSPDTEAIRALNARIAADERVDIYMAAIADGITFARKR